MQISPTPQAPEHQLESRFFDLSTGLMCVLDFRGHFKHLNPAWEKILGFSIPELMSKRFIDFVHPDDRESTRRKNRDVRLGGKARSFENRYMCKNGEYRWLSWNSTRD